MKTYAFALGLSLVASSAMAQQLAEPLRPIGNLPAPFNILIPNYTDLMAPHPWSGFFIDPSIKYQKAQFTKAGGKTLKDAQGFTLGGEAGYNFQYGNFVFGPAADVSYSFMDGKGKAFAPLGTKSEISLFGSVRGRAGYTFDRTFVYATGGYAFADVKVRGGLTGQSDSQVLSGWTAGGGVEYLWNRNALLRFEYRRTSLNGQNFYVLPTGQQKVGAQMNMINVGFVRKF